jgi:low temperature requirement protein LtrA
MAHERLRAFSAGFAAAFALILVSFFVAEELRMLLWGVAVLLDISTPALSERTQRDLPPISRDKFPERFGLFTMIILGEVVASVIGGLVEVNGAGEFTGATAVNAVLGLAIGFGMWWVYYDFIARRPFRPSVSIALEADEPTHPVVSPVLKIAVALLLVPVVFVPELPVAAALGIALLALAVQAVYGSFVWFRKVR